MSTTYRCDLCGVTVRNIGDIEAMHLGNSNTKCQWQGDVCKRCRNRLSRAKAKAEISEMQTIKDENKILSCNRRSMIDNKSDDL